MKIQKSVERLIKTDQGSAPVTTARVRIGRAKRVRFEGDDSSDPELVIQGVTVSRDLLIQAAFPRQGASGRRHEFELKHGC